MCEPAALPPRLPLQRERLEDEPELFIVSRMFSLNTIRSFRRARGWRQSDLAERAGCSQTEISAYERGESVPALPTALAIAVALGRRIEELFFEHFEAACARVGERIQTRYVPDPQ